MNEHKNFIDNTIEENRYTDPNSSLGRIAFGTLFYQPLIESYIKNAYARNTGSAMYNAINNGGFYSNYTFLGGNTIFGGEGSFLRKIPGIKKLYTNSNLDSHKQLFNIKGNTSFNYINPKQNTRNYVTSGGIKNANDMLESGFGFGKKYNFTDKDRFLYNNFVKSDNTDIRSSMIRGIRKQLKSTVTKDFYSRRALELSKVEDIVNQSKKLDGDGIKSVLHKVFNKEEIDSINLSSSNAKEEILNLIKRERNIVEANKNYKIYDLFKDNDLAKSTIENINSIIENSSELNKKQLKQLSKILDIKDIKKISKIYKTAGKEGIYGQALYSVLGDEAIEESIEGTIKKISSAATRSKIVSILDGVLGSKVGMFLTGALGGPIGIGVQVALGVASAISVAHQEKSINDFVNNSISNYNNYDFIESEQGISSLGSHYAINQSNYQDYSSIVSNRNISKNSLRDIDPIQIDSQLSDSKNFTIF